jgi:hypothetical protein
MINKNNLPDVNPLDVEIIRQAQNKVLRAYRRFGNWRKVGEYFGVAHVYAWDLVMHGTVPRNPKIRKSLKLPKKLPSERKAKGKRLDWRKELSLDLLADHHGA